MAEHDEFELRVVESMEPLHAMKLARPVPPSRARAVPTRTEALEALQRTKGASSVFRRVAALEQISAWGEIAYWSVCGIKGEAAKEILIWDCDFRSTAYTMRDGYNNCTAYFAGADEFADVVPPEVLAGQVWCYLDAPTTGYYLFVAQLETYLNLGYAAVVECLIDSSSFGALTILTGHPHNHPFVAQLAAGRHRFQIKQVTGAFFFEGLTAWQIPVIEE